MTNPEVKAVANQKTKGGLNCFFENMGYKAGGEVDQITQGSMPDLGNESK